MSDDTGLTNRTALPLATFDKSRRQIEAAGRFLPGGVSSNFRLGMLPTPLIIERSDGPYVFDVDGNRLIDYYLGMGPMILGHNPEAVQRAVAAQLDRGILYGGQSRFEAETAELFCALVPCAEKLRFTSSGSEAVQAALRLARAATGRRVDPQIRGPLPRLVRQHPGLRHARPRKRRRSRASEPQSAAAPGRTRPPGAMSMY